MMLYIEFKKNPSALYTIIIVNLAMCLFGFWVSYNDILLCTLWSLLFIFSSLNQGHVLSNTITRIGDISCAIAIFVLYSIMYHYSGRNLLFDYTYLYRQVAFISVCRCNQCMAYMGYRTGMESKIDYIRHVS